MKNYSQSSFNIFTIFNKNLINSYIMELNHLAHEVINPLNIIVGCAELTINELKNKKLEKNKIKNYLDLIVQQSLECTNLLKKSLLCKNEKVNINIYDFIKNIIFNYKNHPLLKQKNLSLLLLPKINL